VQMSLRDRPVPVRDLRRARSIASAINAMGRSRRSAGNAHSRLAPSVRDALKRRYKRDYMRRWRSDPRNIAQEAVARKQGYYERKCRRVLQALGASAAEPPAPVCGFCGHRAPICEVERLSIGTDPKGSFTRVLVPYCGNC